MVMHEVKPGWTITKEWEGYTIEAKIASKDIVESEYAGGGFKYGQHLAFDSRNNTPLCRLFVSMLQNMGIETDSFSSGIGTLPGLVSA